MKNEKNEDGKIKKKWKTKMEAVKFRNKK